MTDGDAAIHELQQMLADPNIEVAVRQGDIYAVIVEYFAANNNFKSALNALQDMKAKLPKVSLKFIHQNLAAYFSITTKYKCQHCKYESSSSFTGMMGTVN